MGYDDLFVFLKDNFPKIAIELKDCIDLFNEALNEAFREIQNGIQDAHKTGDLQKITDFNERSYQVSSLSKKIRTYYEIMSTNDKSSNSNNSKKKISRINYDDFRVDPNVPHYLYENFTWTRPIKIQFRDTSVPVLSWKDVLVAACHLLYEENPTIFNTFIDDKQMRGRSRRYFRNSSTGMRKPAQIDGSDLYVETNMSANSIRDLITRMLQQYKINSKEMLIYLEKDLSLAHKPE